MRKRSANGSVIDILIILDLGTSLMDAMRSPVIALPKIQRSISDRNEKAVR